MTRSVIDISVLDACMQEQVAQHGSLRDFNVVLWKQDPDATGCNWNAHIERIRGSSANDERWWHVVPGMRERFNLS